MGTKIAKNRRFSKSPIKELLEKETSIADVELNKTFLLSFKHLDKNQGTSFKHWQDSLMLAKMMDVLQGYCSGNLTNQIDGKKFTKYGHFPIRSAYTHPKHVPQDAEWARIHVDGLHIIAGHIVQNIFFVVFLDHDHKFYITEKKNS